MLVVELVDEEFEAVFVSFSYPPVISFTFIFTAIVFVSAILFTVNVTVVPSFTVVPSATLCLATIPLLFVLSTYDTFTFNP